MQQELIFFGVVTTDDFLELADAAIAAESVAQRFSAISNALGAYDKLNDTDKEAVAEKYATLTELVESYNTDAEAVNAEHNSVVSVVICIYKAPTLTSCVALPVRKEY